MKHNLKIFPEYYEAVKNGDKTFEVRRNDRGFQKGDIVVLEEYELPKRWYTGRQIIAQVGYVLPIDNERVVFSLLNISTSVPF